VQGNFGKKITRDGLDHFQIYYIKLIKTSAAIPVLGRLRQRNMTWLL
jgi:hypothetical protein